MIHYIQICNCRLIKDLVIIIISATGGGIIFSCMGQPVSTSEIFYAKLHTSSVGMIYCYFLRSLLATYLPVLLLDLGG
jgi:hypothetical protein